MQNYSKNVIITEKSDFILKLAHKFNQNYHKYASFKFCSKMYLLVCCMLLRVDIPNVRVIIISI